MRVKLTPSSDAGEGEWRGTWNTPPRYYRRLEWSSDHRGRKDALTRPQTTDCTTVVSVTGVKIPQKKMCVLFVFVWRFLWIIGMKHESRRSELCHKGHHKNRNIPHSGESNPFKFIIRKYHCCFCSIKYKSQYLIIIIIITSTHLPLPQLTKKTHSSLYVDSFFKYTANSGDGGGGGGRARGAWRRDAHIASPS